MTLSRSALLVTALVAVTACSSAPDAESEEENLGTSSQAICIGGRANCLPPTAGTIIIGGSSGVLAPDTPTPQAGQTFECAPPQYEMINGTCYVMGRVPGPGGTYP
ncbi:MAG: hypothetical protein KF819_26440, partial [Labilithrix sp.]|nr:hypothetical protein [Labilithrix sp.]